MKKTLVIEDNEDNLELITFILEKHGYKILSAKSGKKGVEMALEKRPDFIVLDIQLPDMNGLQVLEKIRRFKDRGNIPIIAMTAAAMKGDKERLLSAGCNGYIEKPINATVVIAQIEEILKKTL